MGGFRAAISFSMLLVLALVALKQVLLSLKSDRTIGLLIVNTLCTNMLLYPLSNLVFPVIFKAIPEGAIETEGSMVSALILWLQGLIGIQKKKAWMNYAAVVSLGGVIGPFMSNAMTYWIQRVTAAQPTHANWIGVNCGIIGQLVTLLPLVGVLRMLQLFSAGMRIFLLFAIWGAMTAANNVTTIYFNAHTQQRLGRDKRGSFIANILTLFTLANTLGSTLYGWALASGDAEEQISSSTTILLAAVILRVAVLAALHSSEAGKETMLLKKKD